MPFLPSALHPLRVDPPAGKPFFQTASSLYCTSNITCKRGVSMADSVSRTVMIVEDSRVQAIELSELLCANGYDVLLAGNGKEASPLSKRVSPAVALRQPR